MNTLAPDADLKAGLREGIISHARLPDGGGLFYLEEHDGYEADVAEEDCKGIGR